LTKSTFAKLAACSIHVATFSNLRSCQVSGRPHYHCRGKPICSLGYLTLWAHGDPMPGVSTLNATDGVTASNIAIIGNVNGETNAYAYGVTQLILDIPSYFAP
jgi:hypothetical protein